MWSAQILCIFWGDVLHANMGKKFNLHPSSLQGLFLSVFIVKGCKSKKVNVALVAFSTFFQKNRCWKLSDLKVCVLDCCSLEEIWNPTSAKKELQSVMFLSFFDSLPWELHHCNVFKSVQPSLTLHKKQSYLHHYFLAMCAIQIHLSASLFLSCLRDKSHQKHKSNIDFWLLGLWPLTMKTKFWLG